MLALVMARGLVESDDQKTALAKRVGIQESRHELREPAVADAGLAVVHVVAQIGDDQVEVGGVDRE